METPASAGENARNNLANAGIMFVNDVICMFSSVGGVSVAAQWPALYGGGGAQYNEGV
jgi:hypothetical protein